MADNKILDAISKFAEAIQGIAPGIQQMGVGVSAMEGTSTDAQTLAALKALEDLKKGRLDAKSQMELGKNLEKFKNTPGVQTEMSQSPTGITETYKTRADRSISQADLAAAASADPNLAANPVIQAYLGIAPQQVVRPKAGGGLETLGEVAKGTKIVPPAKAADTGEITYAQAIDIVKEGSGKNGFSKQTVELAQRKINETLASEFDLTPEEIKSPAGKSIIGKILKGGLDITNFGTGRNFSKPSSTQTPNQRNAKINDRVQQLRRTMTDQQIAASLRQKGIDPKSYGLNG